MSVEIIVPSIGESISSGILSSWNVSNGTYVREGDILYELETDKISTEGIAPTSGLIEFKAEEGDEVDIGQVIALIDETAEAPEDNADPIADKTPKERELSEIEYPSSPAVKRLESETGIDPKSLEGSGKDGRVTKGDMLAAAASEKSARQNTPSASTLTPTQNIESPSPIEDKRRTRSKLSPMRRRIAERLVNVQQNAAILTTFNEADMSQVMQIRKTYQESFKKRHGIKLGFMSFFVKAAVQALKEVPALNSQIDGDFLVQNHFYDISVAVSTPKGLMVPVIRNADQKGFAEIEKDIIHYAEKARKGKISIEDIQGGVFTITNGGIFGSMLSTPIINEPQSGILGMHSIQERLMALNGEVVIRPMMYLALSYDHRIVDGREAVTFLKSIKECIEDPTRIFLDA